MPEQQPYPFSESIGAADTAVSGDIVCTDSNVYSIRRITDLMESFGIPWAPMFGNHDDEGNCDKNFLADIMMSGPNCIMSKGDPEMGVGNYIVNIAEDNDNGTLNIIESLIIMDCRAPDRKKQIEWFRWAADGINTLTENSAEISIITHIPLYEYQLAYGVLGSGETWQTDFFSGSYSGNMSVSGTSDKYYSLHKRFGV